jgi:hypothetical protein
MVVLPALETVPLAGFGVQPSASEVLQLLDPARPLTVIEDPAGAE